MTVRLTRIYTKTGDAGQTHLGDMSRVSKTDPRLVAYADVDEANSVLGVGAGARGAGAGELADLLRSVQNDLFDVGADLCTPITPDPEYPPLRVTAGLHRAARGGLRRVQRDAAEAGQLHPARRHPGRRPCCTRRGSSPGGPSAASGRCSRPTASAPTPETARYLNRLSDLLFILARVANPGGDILWEPGAHSGAHAQRAARRSRPTDLSCRAAPTPPRTGSRSPSSGPSPARAGPRRWRSGEDDDVRRAGPGRPGPGRARDSTLELGAAEPLAAAAPTATAPRYQSSTSPPYQATPTDQRGEPTGRSHMVTAPRPESRKRRRSRKATASDDDQHARAGPAGPWSRAAGGRDRLRSRGASGGLAGRAQPGLGPAGGVEGLRARRRRPPRGAAPRGRARRRSRWRSPRSRRGWTRPRSVTDRKPPWAATIDVLAGLGADGDDTALGQLAQQRRVAGQHAQLALGRAGDDHRRLAGPDLPLDGHQLDLQGRHDTPRDLTDAALDAATGQPTVAGAVAGAASRRPASGGAAVQQRPAADADPGTAHGGRRAPTRRCGTGSPSTGSHGA